MREHPYEHRRITGACKKLDIGCGAACRPGYTGIDVRDCKQGIVWDVREGIPLPDSSVEEIVTSHFVEHLDEREIFHLFMEMMRVCKVGAMIRISCPHSSRPEAYFPGHLSLWNEHRIEGITKGSSGAAKNWDKRLGLVGVTQDGMELRAVLQVKEK